MSDIVSIEKLFNQNKHELLLSKLSEGSTDLLFLKLKDKEFRLFVLYSLIYSGYYVKTIELIRRLVEIDDESVERVQILLLLSKCFYYCYNFSEGRKILIEIENQTNQSQSTNNTNDFYVRFEIMKCLLELEPEPIQLIDKLTSIISKLKLSSKEEEMAYYLMEKGVILKANHNFDRSLECLEESLKIYTLFENRFGQAEVYLQLGLLR